MIPQNSKIFFPEAGSNIIENHIQAAPRERTSFPPWADSGVVFQVSSLNYEAVHSIGSRERWRKRGSEETRLITVLECLGLKGRGVFARLQTGDS